MIRYAGIVRDTIVDGIGLRNTLYVSGCSHNCPGCHNKALQSYNYGQVDTFEEIYNKMFNEGSSISNSNDLTLSGGEPFEQALELERLVRHFKKINPDGNVWVYSGYTYEELLNLDKTGVFALLTHCDVLVDGKFDINKKDLNLKFRGSSNQRIIDIQESLKQHQVVLLNI